MDDGVGLDDGGVDEAVRSEEKVIGKMEVTVPENDVVAFDVNDSNVLEMLLPSPAIPDDVLDILPLVAVTIDDMLETLLFVPPLVNDVLELAPFISLRLEYVEETEDNAEEDDQG